MQRKPSFGLKNFSTASFCLSFTLLPVSSEQKASSVERFLFGVSNLRHGSNEDKGA